MSHFQHFKIRAYATELNKIYSAKYKLPMDCTSNTTIFPLPIPPDE